MNPLFKFLVLTILTFVSCIDSKSSATNFEKLLCKKWKLVGYEEAGTRFNTPEKFQINRMKFSLDHTVESSGYGDPSIGDWSYDENHRIITIVDKVTKETVEIGVKSITENELVVLIGKTDERQLTLFMKPESE